MCDPYTLYVLESGSGICRHAHHGLMQRLPGGMLQGKIKYLSDIRHRVLQMKQGSATATVIRRDALQTVLTATTLRILSNRPVWPACARGMLYKASGWKAARRSNRKPVAALQGVRRGDRGIDAAREVP